VTGLHTTTSPVCFDFGGYLRRRLSDAIEVQVNFLCFEVFLTARLVGFGSRARAPSGMILDWQRTLVFLFDLGDR
jgi:hypothetical protein